jgi:hypothetical protein
MYPRLSHHVAPYALIYAFHVRLRCIAALGHDLGHTGTSNAFLVNSRDELALLYNDVAVRYSRVVAECLSTWVRGYVGTCIRE